jgi:hypothetical protein
VGGLRLGGEVLGSFGAVGVAGFRNAASSLVPFGLPFDRGSPLTVVPAATGVETYFSLRVPGTRGLLRLDGSYARYSDLSERPYAPDEEGHVAAVFHGLFLGGQLEPIFRLEGTHRGATPVSAAAGQPFDQIMPAFQSLNFSMHLRILDVQAFVLWDNLLAMRDVITLPGAPPGLPRILYGASWRFRN